MIDELVGSYNNEVAHLVLHMNCNSKRGMPSGPCLNPLMTSTVPKLSSLDCRMACEHLLSR